MAGRRAPSARAAQPLLLDAAAESSPLDEPADALFCDVALPVPLDSTFTYSCGDLSPVAGGRVVVPFGSSSKRLSGIVTRLVAFGYAFIRDNVPSLPLGHLLIKGALHLGAGVVL